ncbi:hypothetical protein M3J09_010683 [Ascochyta lentis]
MKATLLALLALSASASACAFYNDCHCYDKNGKPNNDATKKVCDDLGGTIKADEREYGAGTSYNECEAKTFGGASSFQNCDWRKKCFEAGATGADSSCRSKVP